jgi:NitT/TauT family transport system permease protein
LVLNETPTFKIAVLPYLAFLNAIPRIALAPILILWFGIGQSSKIALAVSVVVFVLILTVSAGVEGVQPEHLQLARVLRMKRIQRFRLILVPTSIPAIVAGLRLGAVYSVLAVVVSEMIASQSGMGNLLVQESNRFNIAGSFAILIMLGVMATLLDRIGLLFQRGDRRGR